MGLVVGQVGGGQTDEGLVDKQRWRGRYGVSWAADWKWTGRCGVSYTTDRRWTGRFFG